MPNVTNVEGNISNKHFEDINETGESSMKKQTERNVKSVISWVEF